MAQWGAFFGVTVLLTVLLLALAYKSQQFIQEHAIEDPPDTLEVDEPTPEPSVSDSTQITAGEEQTLPDAGPLEETQDRVVPESRRDQAVTDPLQDPGATRTPQNQEVTEPHREGPEDIVLTPGMLLGNVAFTQALVLSILVAAAWYFSIPRTAFGIGTDPDVLSPVALGIGFGVVLWMGNELSTAVADTMGASYDERVRELLAPETTTGWVFLFVGVLPLIAITEELLFRAALIGVPAAGFGISPWLLAVGSSIAFAFGHGAQGRVGIVVTGLLGFALAAAFVITESLILVVIAHYVINALEFFVHEYLGRDQVLPIG